MVAVAFCLDAHSQENTEMNGHRWLDCDVDWLIGTPHDVGPNFTVKVSFHKRPVTSVRLLLTGREPALDDRGGRTVATSETDSRGVAQFFAILPGAYEVRIDDGLLAPREQVEVAAHSGHASELRMEWPGTTIATRSLRGLLTLSDRSNREPLPLAHVLVQLLDLRTGKLLALAFTNGDGYYDFPSRVSGLYAVRFNEAQDLSSRAYDIAVEVGPHAREERLPALKMDKVCGTGLSQISQRPDQVLFERGMSAVDEGRFDVAKIILRTLVNTYPDSEYASNADVLLQDPRIAPCGEPWNASRLCDERRPMMSPAVGTAAPQDE